ncbi:hypothetical protein SOM70_37205 [Streptomyces salinarius]|uniref:hypothetical protein n=1 Tax=Streptomyces salinarius TaxID=2762598 RepID=UPI0032DE53F5
MSTDGGRSYGTAVTEAVDHQTAWDNAGPMGLGPGPWPPCQCPATEAEPPAPRPPRLTRPDDDGPRGDSSA